MASATTVVLGLVELIIIIVRLIAIDRHVVGIASAPCLPLFSKLGLSDSL